MEGGAPARERAAGVTGWGILIALLHHARQTVTVRETTTVRETMTLTRRRAARASWKGP